MYRREFTVCRAQNTTSLKRAQWVSLNWKWKGQTSCRKVLSKFPTDSKVKFKVSLEMCYDSAFASLRGGAILKQVQGGLPKSLVGVGWGSITPTADSGCLCLKLKGRVFLKVSQETQEKGIWGTGKSVNQSTQERNHRARPGMTGSKGGFQPKDWHWERRWRVHCRLPECGWQ